MENEEKERKEYYKSSNRFAAGCGLAAIALGIGSGVCFNSYTKMDDKINSYLLSNNIENSAHIKGLLENSLYVRDLKDKRDSNLAAGTALGIFTLLPLAFCFAALNSEPGDD